MMSKIDNKALTELAIASQKELNEVKRRWRKYRVTKLVRFSTRSHNLIKELAKEKNMTMSKTLDYVIKKFIKNNKYYGID